MGIGAVLIGPLTDRSGRRTSLISCIAVFSVCTLLVVGGVAGPLTLPVMWARLPESEAYLASRAGAARVRTSYPPEVRGTALGLTAGVGRVGAIVGPFLGGALVTAGIAYPWGFYLFALASVLAVVALSVVPAHAPSPVPARERQAA